MGTWSISPTGQGATISSSSGLITCSKNDTGAERTWTIQYTDDDGCTASTSITQPKCEAVCTMSFNGSPTHIINKTTTASTCTISFTVQSRLGDNPSPITTFTATSISKSGGTSVDDPTVDNYTVTQGTTPAYFYTCFADVHNLNRSGDSIIVFKVENECGQGFDDIKFIITHCPDRPTFTPAALTSESWSAHTNSVVYTRSCNSNVSSAEISEGIFTIQSSAHTTTDTWTFTISFPEYLNGPRRTDYLIVKNTNGDTSILTLQQSSKNGGDATSGQGRCNFIATTDPTSEPSSINNDKLTIFAPYNKNGTQSQLDAMLNALSSSDSISIVWKYVDRSDHSITLTSYTDSLSYVTIKNVLTLEKYKATNQDTAYKLYDKSNWDLRHFIPRIPTGGYSLEITVSNLPTNMYASSTYHIAT